MIHLPSAGVTGVAIMPYFMVFLLFKRGLYACSASLVPTDPHLQPLGRVLWSFKRL